MTEQEKFEETIRGKWSTLRRGDKSNEYVALLAQTAWEGWQTAIASREPMTQQQQANIVHPDDDMATFIRTIASVERFHGIGE